MSAVLCSLGLVACSAGDQPDAYVPKGDVTLSLTRLPGGGMEYCNADGECQTLPYDGECAELVIAVDTATGQTCQKCVLEDGSVIDQGCGQASVGCVLVTLPDPDCVVCAYVNGAVIFSSCVVVEPECRADGDCIDDSGLPGKCVDNQCLFEPGCFSNADCPPGFFCEFWSDRAATDPNFVPVERGICVPEQINCSADSECPPEMYCAFVCMGPADFRACPEGSDNCAAPIPCDGVCLPKLPDPCAGMVCGVGEHCEVACSANRDRPCASTETCAPGCEPVCVPDPKSCENSEQCGDGMECQFGPCPMMPCTPEFCPPCLGVCVPADLSCQTNVDCPEGMFCEFEPCYLDCVGCCPDYGKCIPIAPPSECTVNEDCGSPDLQCVQRCWACIPEDPNCQPGCTGVCEPILPPDPCLAVDCAEGNHCELVCPSEFSGAGAPFMPCPETDPFCGCRPACVPDQTAVDCRSTADCQEGLVCSTELGDCSPSPSCREGQGCTTECWGKCVQPLPPSPCDNVTCNAGEHCEVTCLSERPCRIDDPYCGCVGACVSDVPECVRTGCSGELCAEREMASICIYLPEYACYQAAECARQTSGACGWTMTAELRECLAGSGNSTATR